jgi:hypothetical protein
MRTAGHDADEQLAVPDTERVVDVLSVRVCSVSSACDVV